MIGYRWPNALLASFVLAGSALAAEPRQIYIVSLAEPAAALFETPAQLGVSKRAALLEPTAISVTGARRLDAKSAPVRRYVDYLHERQDDVLATASQRVKRALTPKFRYDLVANGFAVELTQAEADAMASVAGVVSVRPDFRRKLLTDAGPQWIGADAVWDGVVQGSNIRTRGEGIVVGVVDSGVNTSHPSFQDVAADGYDHANPRGQRYGICAGGDTRCNDKLIGMYDYINETCSFDTTAASGKDCGGHGTHVASTAVGNPFTLDQALPTTSITRRMSGVAPRANLIAYKVCFEKQDDGCSGSAIVSALNQAVADGVDVVNYSIGGGAYDPWSSVRNNGIGDDAAAFLAVRAAGIVPVVAAGNEGPGTSTVSSPGNSPWVITVSNISSGRRYSTSVTGISGYGVATPFSLIGDGMTAGITSAPIVHAKDYGNALCGVGASTNNVSTCTTSASNPFPAGSLAGKIVICDRGTYARIEKGCNVKLAGAVGMILANVSGGDANVVSDGHFLPATHLGATDGNTLRTLVENARLAGQQITGSISSVALRNDGAGDVLNSSSSRGPVTPYSGVLKPTVAAPGTSIIAAYHRSSSAAIMGGTSMASPHVAGAAALLLAGNPNWTVAQVESALVGTASNTLKLEDGVTSAPYVAGGAGRARVDQAARSGLYFNVTTTQFREADPSAGGDPKQLNLPFVHSDRCVQSCSFTRSVTANTAGQWRVEATMPAGATVTVSPSEFSATNSSAAPLAITVNIVDPTLIGSWIDGQIRLVPVGNNDVATTTVPVSVYAAAGTLPAEVTIETDTTNGFSIRSFDGFVALNDLTLGATQLRTLQTISGSTGPDTDNDPYNGTSGVRTLFVGPPTTGNNVPAIIHAAITNTAGGDKDVYIGYDANNNGTAEESELLCSGNSPASNDTCTLDAVFPNADARYWVLVQKLSGQAETVKAEVFVGATDGSTDNSLAFSGPRITAAQTAFPTRIAWNLPSLAVGETAMGFLRVGASRNRPEGIGRIPVRIKRTAASTPAAIVLNGLGDRESIALAAGEAHERIVIDVPPNATALHLATSGTGEVDLYVAKATAAPTPPVFAAAPARGQAQGTSIHAGATEAVDLLAPTLTPGRWYVTPVNTGTTVAKFDLTAQLEFGAGAVFPTMRSYNNKDRNGHGIFLSQVGPVWALIWYTYFEDGTPTYYLASTAAPSGNNGVWRAPLYRVTWSGTQSYLNKVGEVIITPESSTRFTYSWLLDGTYGSESFDALAPLSCASVGGVPTSYSGGWYSPPESGWGFSIDSFATVEANAAYLFDAAGVARWALGVTTAPGVSTSMTLKQLHGFCPTCAAIQTTNVAVGTLSRQYSDDSTGSVTLDVTWQDSVPGRWQRSGSTQSKINGDMPCQ